MDVAVAITAAERLLTDEQPGEILVLSDGCFEGLNISDFQYGKYHESEACPVFTVTADDESKLAALPDRLKAGGYEWEDLSGAVDVQFRAISLREDLLNSPLFLRLDFYERPGALHDFLDKIVRGRASFCYFNYRQSGERVGRALIGLDFDSAAARQDFTATLAPRGDGYRLCQPLDAAAQARMLGA